MNILEQIDSKEFRDYLVNEVIKTKEINGRLIVPNDFVLEIEASDPYYWMDRFMEKDNKLKEMSSEEKEKSEVALHFVNIHIKRAIKEEISKINNDVNSEINSHIKILESFGFDKIYEKEYIVNKEGFFEDTENAVKKIKNDRNKEFIGLKSVNGLTKIEYTEKETENFYYNKRNGMLCHFDTHQGEINSIEVYLQGMIKDREKLDKLMPSKGYILCSENIYAISIDGRDMLSAKLEVLSEIIKFEPKWKEFELSLYSYLSHKEKNGKIEEGCWKTKKIEKLNEFPLYVLNNIFNENLNYNEIDNVIENFVLEKGLNKNYFKIKEFKEELDIEDAKDILVRNNLFDAQYSEKGVVLFIPKTIKNKARNFGIEFDNIHNYSSILIEKSRDMVNELEPEYRSYDDISRMRNQIIMLSPEELVIVKKITANNVFIENNVNIILKEINDLSENKITHKIKNTLQ